MTQPTDSQPQPQPVLNAARLGGLVSAAFVACGGCYFLITQGISRDSLSTIGVAIEGAITAVIALAVYVVAVVHGKAAQEKVTPLASPRDHKGRALVPVEEYGKHAVKYQQGGYIPGGPVPTVNTWVAADKPVYTAEQVRKAVAEQRRVQEFLNGSDDTQEIPRVTSPTPYLRRPRSVSSSYTGRQVARAYGLDGKWSGKGFTGGIVELGGGFGTSDVRAYFAGLGLPIPGVVAVAVAGGNNTSDGPDGADAEVLLDIEVAAAVAPGAAFRVYFAPNTDDGFLAAVERAVQECDAVSISWGGPENAWDPDTMDAFDQVFAAARKAGVPVFAAAGDTGSGDSGGRGNHVDFPASSPNVVGCGGTRLTLSADGSRAAEVVWDDNDTSSATGGGVSVHFPGRDVPDVAGNADPQTGYQVLVDGERAVIGGTSAVAPLYLGMYLAVLEALGGRRFDFLNTVVTNPQVCFDVTSGDNGGFRAGPGRDQTTGFGVVDVGKLLEVLTDPIPDPAPPTPAPPGAAPMPAGLLADLTGWAHRALVRRHDSEQDKKTAKELLDWEAQQ